MAKKKGEVNTGQLDFLVFVPLSRDVSDVAVEVEIYQESGKKIYPDDHPVLMAYRSAYFSKWVEDHPNGFLAKYSQEME